MKCYSEWSLLPPGVFYRWSHEAAISHKCFLYNLHLSVASIGKMKQWIICFHQNECIFLEDRKCSKDQWGDRKIQLWAFCCSAELKPQLYNSLILSLFESFSIVPFVIAITITTVHFYVVCELLLFLLVWMLVFL